MCSPLDAVPNVLCITVFSETETYN